MDLFDGPQYFLVCGLLTVATLILLRPLVQKAAGLFGLDTSGAGAKVVTVFIVAALAFLIFVFLSRVLGELYQIIPAALMVTAAFFIPWWLTIRIVGGVKMQAPRPPVMALAAIMSLILFFPFIFIFSMIFLIAEYAIESPEFLSVFILFLIGGYIYRNVTKIWAAEISRTDLHPPPVLPIPPNWIGPHHGI